MFTGYNVPIHYFTRNEYYLSQSHPLLAAVHDGHLIYLLAFNDRWIIY